MSSVRKTRVLEDINKLLELQPEAVRAAAVAADGVFRRAEVALFRSEGASGGERWAALSPEYKAQKDRWFSGMRSKERALRASTKGPVKRLTGENKILQVTGAMKRGLSTQGGEHVAEGFIAGGKGVIRLGVTGRSGMIAMYHYVGGKRLPIRKPIELTSAVTAQMAAAIREALKPWLERGLRARAQADKFFAGRR